MELMSILFLLFLASNSDESICEETESLSTSKKGKLSDQNVACEEVEVPPKLQGSSAAVSDVAKAIEDLLAQSAMVQ